MKHLLCAAALCIVCLSANAQNNTDSEIVLELTDAESSDILKIYGAFEDNDAFRIINSCEILGWIVFEPVAGQSATKATTRAFVQTKLDAIDDLPPYRWNEELSKIEVPMMCREAMQGALNPEGN